MSLDYLDEADYQRQQDDERQQQELLAASAVIAKWDSDSIGSTPHKQRAYQGTMDDYPSTGDIREQWGAGYTHPKERE